MTVKVDIRIDPNCQEPSAVITAPAMTEELRALAARLEGGAALIGWDGDTAVPLSEGDILRCYGEEKGVKVQTAGGVYDLRERLYELEAKLDRHTFVRISHSEIVNLRRVAALDLTIWERSPPWTCPSLAPSGSPWPEERCAGCPGGM